MSKKALSTGEWVMVVATVIAVVIFAIGVIVSIAK